MTRSIETGMEDFRTAAADLSSDGYRLMDMFAEEPYGPSGTVSALFRRGADTVRLWYPTDGRGVTLSRDIPSASPFERRMAEMSGTLFDTDTPPIVYRRKGDGHPLQKAPYDRSTEVRIPLPPNGTQGDDVFEIPVGPVHAGIIEPGHFRFSVAGEPVIELNPSLGYTHRGVEKLMEVPAGRDVSRLVERISGDTCVANCIAYSEIMESGTDIPRRAKVIRVLMAEMERLYNHIGAVSGICTDTAFNVPSAIGSGLQEKVFRMNMSLTRHRQLMNCVVPGGVRRDIPDSRLRELDDFLIKLKFEIADLTDMMMDSPALQDRLEGTGVLTNDAASSIGAVGPIARASGVVSDVRRDAPYECYADLGLNVPSDRRGDVNARTLVRIGEIYESISLVHQCTEMLEPGETRVRAVPPDGFHCAVVEAPRGELVHSAVVRDGRIWRYSVRDPSFVNWFGMCHAVPGNVVPDFPLINKSFGLSYAGNDLRGEKMFGISLSNLAGRNRNTEPAGDLMSARGTMPMASAECTGCGTCADNCPTRAILLDGGEWRVDLGRCVFCMDCAMVCPADAIGEVPAPDYALSREDLVVGRDHDIEDIEKAIDPSVSRMFSGSLAMRELDTGSCNACEIELNCMSNQFYDAHRFGMKVVASPRHADALVVTGPMTENMREAAVRTDDAVPRPRLVVASGTCAISGGVFVGGDVAPSGISDTLEPDIYVIGCPPSPDRVIRALVRALGMRH